MNRVRVGKHTNEDLATLKKRVKAKDHADLQTASLYIMCKRKPCYKMNNGHINSLDEDLFTVEAKHHYATQSKTKPKPYISPYDGVVGPTSFMDNLKLKIGAKMMIIYNIDTADGLTNGQMGTLVHIVMTTKGEVDKLIIRLNNSKTEKN